MVRVAVALVRGGDLPRFGCTDCHRIGKVHHRVLSPCHRAAFVCGQGRLPLLEATLVPPHLQVQVQLRAPAVGQTLMCGAPGPGFDDQTEVRQARQIEHQLGASPLVEVGQNDHCAALVTTQQGHEIFRITCHDAELFGQRPDRATQAPPRAGRDGVDGAFSRSLTLAAVVHEPGEQPRLPAPF
ncbi:hypothetical protein ABZY19_30590 [Streptomyces sp. NPDC006475]|uniref:hypothetical protein n=1 Tax=Streptomyces sp. NPDC006475 TaxID=3155719 RepID=UPI0033A49860